MTDEASSGIPQADLGVTDTVIDTTPTIEPSTAPDEEAVDASATADTVSDTDDSETTADQEKDEKDLKERMDSEVAWCAETGLNTSATDLRRQYEELPPAERSAFFAKDHNMHLITRSRILDLKDGPQQFTIQGNPSRYRHEGKGITAITAVSGELFTCTTDSPTGETITLPRADLLKLMFHADYDLIADGFQGKNRELMDRYHATQNPDSLPDTHYDGLPDILSGFAEANKLHQPSDLRTMARTIVARSLPATDSDTYAAAKAEADALLASIDEDLKGTNISSAEDVQRVFDRLQFNGTQASIHLETSKITLAHIQEQKKNGKITPEAANAEIDRLTVEIEIYEQILPLLSKDGEPTKTYFSKVNKGQIPLETREKTIDLTRKGDIQALILMAIPDISKEQMVKAQELLRVKGEKWEKYAKGAGILALALLLITALGISQGAKQQ